MRKVSVTKGSVERAESIPASMAIFFATVFLSCSLVHAGHESANPSKLRLTDKELAGFWAFVIKPAFPWIGDNLLQEDTLRVKYHVTYERTDRPGYPIYFAIYSRRLKSGVFLDVNWNGRQCGEFFVRNNAEFEIRGNNWVLGEDEGAPLGGVWTRQHLEKQIEQLSKIQRVFKMNPRKSEQGCGTWTSFVGGGK